MSPAMDVGLMMLSSWLLLAAAWASEQHLGSPLQLDASAPVSTFQRHLLQADQVSGSKDDSKSEHPGSAARAVPFPEGEYMLGPKIFYDGSHFAMALSSPVEVSIFDGDSEVKVSSALATVRLDAPAYSVKGSMINADKDDFKVNLDWKRQDFGSQYKITNVQINLYFRKQASEYLLYQMEVVQLIINGKQILANGLHVKTSRGHEVRAPLGTSFHCDRMGLFLPAKAEHPGPFKVGVTLPDVRLQVFNVKNRFGPEWSCHNVFSIGLWVGLIITLFFAAICVWGFSMLANIQTMDRFDDPKGKAIYVPQTE